MLNFKAISLFSSAGIAETYFERQGVHVRVASELLEERVKLYHQMYPNVRMFQGDITNQDNYNQIIDAAREENCDFLLATPPCQGMSKAGLKKKGDPRNSLILIVIKAIKDIQPKFAIIENVPEITWSQIEYNGELIKIGDLLERELGTDYGFNEQKIVNTMNYGIAQSRERCVFWLSRKDTNIKWEFPKAEEHILTMRDAIGDLPSLDPFVTDITEEQRRELFPDFDKKKKAGLLVSPWHRPPRHVYRHVIAMMHTPEGCSAMNNKVYFPAKKDGTKTKGFNNTYKRQHWDKPAFTITMYTSRIGSQQNGHPGHPIIDSEDEEKRIWSDPRTMTIFEIMRLTSLPDDWNMPLDTSDNLVREVMGEGVPPKLLEKALIELDKAINEYQIQK